jgi:ceramide glucosyltransferase
MAWLAVTWTVLASIFTLAAILRLRDAAARGASTSAGVRVRRRPHVLLLRPADAPTPLELENFAAPIDYSGELTHVVVSPFRPRLQSPNVRWLPSDPLTTNRKVGHLAYALATLPREENTVVLCVDADVRVDGALVSSLVEELRAGSALASAAPRPGSAGSLAGKAVRGLLVQSHHSFTVLDLMSVGAKAVCGKALALGPEAEAELVRLGDCIGEDLELSTLMHEKGLTVSMASAFAHVPQPASLSLAAVTDRFTRWMQVLRAHRGALFPAVPLFFAPTPLLMALAAWLATPATAIWLFVLVALRITMANRLDPRPGWRFEWLLAEVLLLVCWFESLRAGHHVTWRGRRFEVRSGGRMVLLPGASSEAAT